MLSKNDLQQIKEIVHTTIREEVRPIVREEAGSIVQEALVPIKKDIKSIKTKLNRVAKMYAILLETLMKGSLPIQKK